MALLESCCNEKIKNSKEAILKEYIYFLVTFSLSMFISLMSYLRRNGFHVKKNPVLFMETRESKFSAIYLILYCIIV